MYNIYFNQTGNTYSLQSYTGALYCLIKCLKTEGKADFWLFAPSSAQLKDI